jgi:hypothetical protein
MNGFPFFDSQIFTWVVIPVLIILARIVDVTLDTIRIIYISRGMKYLAPLFGFFEILIWLLAISQIMRNLNNPVYYLAYAVGFATGNLVGIFVDRQGCFADHHPEGHHGACHPSEVMRVRGHHGRCGRLNRAGQTHIHLH